MADKEVGRIKWADLTVPNADEVRDFYKEVVGWEHTGLDMGGYEDYCMNEPAGGQTIAGICHARGSNAQIPPVWLIYISVENLDRSMKRCREQGGKVLLGPKKMGGQGRYCVIEDPAGCVAALWEAME